MVLSKKLIYTMHHLKATLSTVFVLLMMSICHAQAERPIDGYYFSQPKLYKLFPEETESTASQFMNANFFPIGWSGDGKMAYLKEPADEACGCYFMDLVVYDLVTNKEVYHYAYVEAQDTVHAEGKRAHDLASGWEMFSSKFTSVLDSFHIEKADKWSNIGNDFKEGEHSYKLSMAAEKKKVPDFGGDFVKQYVISLDKDTVKGKMKFTAGPEQPSHIMDVNLMRTFRHPTGKWVAAVYRVYYRGWEGPPNVNDFAIAGFKL